MMAARGILVLLILVAAVPGGTAWGAGGASVAAVEKVIKMLQDMSVKAKADKKAEEVKHASFGQWCTDEKANVEAGIVKGEEKVELLGAQIGKLSEEVELLGGEIGKLQANVATYAADRKEQEEQRKVDHAAYVAESQDYAESIDALERAIAVLQQQNYDRKGAGLLQTVQHGKKAVPGTLPRAAKEALLQISTRAIEGLPVQARAEAAAMLSMLGGDREDLADYAAPEANAYEFQSGGIIDVLKSLLQKFTEKKGQNDKEEANSAHAASMVAQDLTDSIENAEEDVGEKTKTKEAKAEAVAAAKGDLAQTSKLLADDKDTLSKMEAECSMKGLSFEEKQRLRTEEIEAIAKAIEVLSGETVSGAAGKYLGLSQAGPAAPPSLLQLSNAGGSEGIRRTLREFLEQRAGALHSEQLAMLASASAVDPFAKVKALIENMITRLLEEAHTDASHEGWCDTEIGQSKVTRNKLSEELDGLTAAIDDGKAAIMALTQEIASLEREVAQIQAAMTQATSLRADEKAKNDLTIKDAQAAQQAIIAAMKILKDFYDRASLATALLQSNAPKMGSEEWRALANPNYEANTATWEGTVKVDKGHKAGMQTFGSAYTGQQDEAGGVLAMLEVILSDFANLEADTTADEVQAQTAYNTFMADAERDVAAKTQKVQLDAADKAAAEANQESDIKDLKATEDELLAADRYYDKLKPQCIKSGTTFEKRTKSREEEIQSLKEALEILDGAAAP